ncbi:hypothetical protein PENTCL1PPCAC_2779 [Pristionchus entomophagus]|uniref:BTB domain-containing protein n=1 Tax=Pristionchus entomophagus TaxID=358040 RepID=A0AAV5SKK3_9BILA|nr:hypothetical protein PENTCL1PPCAC_2779 [Pristionchus entomophagus]
MSPEEELAKLREQNRLLHATINDLKEKMDKEQPCINEHNFVIDLACPGETEQVGREETSEESDLDGVNTAVLAKVVLNSSGEQQVEVWPKLSCENAFDLTLFTDLQLITKTNETENKPILFGLHSELVRIMPGRELQCTKIVVPEWQQKYAVQCRGQTVQLRCRVKIVRSFKHIETEIDEEGSEEIEVGGKRICVNLAYLSSWSAEFRNGSHTRSRVINELSETDFEEMLEVIYPSSKPITSWNFEKMLNIAKKLKMPKLTRRCEIFLNDEEKHNLTEFQTLLLADTFSLNAIKTIVLERISSTEMLRSKVLMNEKYLQFTPDMKKDIHARYVELDLQEKTAVEI